MKQIHIVGGGTVFHVRPHLAISAIAYGGTALKIAEECKRQFDSKKYKVITHLTKMACADKSSVETNEDVKNLLNQICQIPESKVLFLPVALCDFTGYIVESNIVVQSGKEQPRLNSRNGNQTMKLAKAEKLIEKVKSKRSDILLIGFKTTSNIPETETIAKAQKLLNDSDCDFVFANDIYKRINVIVGKRNYTSEFYKNRNIAIKQLVQNVAKLS